MTHDLDTFKKTLIYRRTAPIDVLLEDLAGVRAFDGKHEKLNVIWILLGVVGLVGVFFGFLLLSRSQGAAGSPFYPGLILMGVSAALVLAGFGLAMARWRFNLENRRYELAERVLQFLKRDSKPDAEVSLVTDFRKPDVKEKHIRKNKVGVWDVNYYTDRWLQVSGRLLDGTSYQVRVIEQHQVRGKTYRSRSGKVKHKSKQKSASELILRLKVKTRRYPRLSQLFGPAKSAPKTVQLPEWATLKACRIDAPEKSEVGNLLLRTTTKQTWTCAPAGKPEDSTSGVRWFAMSFLSLYQVLNIASATDQA